MIMGSLRWLTALYVLEDFHLHFSGLNIIDFACLSTPTIECDGRSYCRGNTYFCSSRAFRNSLENPNFCSTRQSTSLVSAHHTACSLFPMIMIFFLNWVSSRIIRVVNSNNTRGLCLLTM